MAAEVRIIISGQDNASGVLGKVRQEVGGIGQEAQKQSGGVGGFFGGIASVAGGILASNVITSVGGQITGMFTGGIEDARNTVQLMGQTEAVIKSTGGAAGVTGQQVADYATALSDASGKSLFGDDQIQQSENLLLTFTEIKGKTLEAATAISVDMAQALGGAPKDSAIQLGKALNDPIAGITALSRVGVSFTDQQKEQIKTMQDAGDMAGAQGVILAELNKEFGGSAQAAATAAGPMAQFKAIMGETAESVGASLLPAIGMLGTLLMSPAVQGAIQSAASALSAGIGAAIQWLSTVGIPMLIVAFNLVAPIVMAAVSAFQSGGESAGALGTVIRTLGGIWNELLPVITNVVNAVRAVVMAVLAQIQTFIAAHGADISATMGQTWNQIVQIVRTAIQLYNAVVPPVLQAIAAFITAHGAEIQAIMGNTWNAIKAVIDVALTLIQGVLKAALQLIQGDWSGAWETIKAMSARIVQDLITVIQSGIGNIVTLFGGLAKQVGSALQGLVDGAAAIGSGIVNGIISGVQAAAGNLLSYMRQLGVDAIEAVKHALGISSPSAVAAQQIGMPFAQGIVQGMLGGAPMVASGGAGLGQLALAGAGAGTSINASGWTITGSPGMNIDQLANEVIDKLERRIALRG